MTGKRALKQSQEATRPSQWLIQRLCADKCRFSSVPLFFMFVDHISSHIGLVQTERNLLMPNISEFRDLSEIELFKMLTWQSCLHIVLVVMATNYLSWLLKRLLYMVDACNNYQVNRA